MDSKFCVPQAYRVKPLWWVDANSGVDSLGFSFNGCSLARLGAGQACVFPHEVIGGDVEPRFLNEHIYWRSIKGGGSLVGLGAHESAVYEYLDDGHIIVASAPGVDDDWRVFARQEPVSTHVIGLIDSDALLLRCGNETGASKMKYVCSRYHRGVRYSVRYEFRTNEKVPLMEMARHDDALIRIIDGWQCDL